MIAGIIFLIIIIACLIFWLILAKNDAKFYEQLFKESQNQNSRIIEMAKRVLKSADEIIDNDIDIIEFNKKLVDEQRELSEVNIKLITLNEVLRRELENREETNNDCERVSEGSVEDCEQTTEC